jgi:DNA-binding MarR family transcriptional regulator
MLSPVDAAPTQPQATDDVTESSAAPPVPALSTLHSQLRMAILRLSRRLRQQAVGQITASQISALAAVSKHGELSLGELAAIEQIAPPSMTRIAARLEAQGLL